MNRESKLLQLKSLTQAGDRYCIDLCILQDDQRNGFRMEVDSTTFLSLSRIYNVHQEGMIAISFRGYFNPNNQKHYCILHILQSDEVLRLLVECAESFLENVHWIEQNVDVNSVVETVAIEEVQKEPKIRLFQNKRIQQPVSTKSDRRRYTFRFVARPILTLVLCVFMVLASPNSVQIEWYLIAAKDTISFTGFPISDIDQSQSSNELNRGQIEFLYDSDHDNQQVEIVDTSEDKRDENTGSVSENLVEEQEQTAEIKDIDTQRVMLLIRENQQQETLYENSSQDNSSQVDMHTEDTQLLTTSENETDDTKEQMTFMNLVKDQSLIRTLPAPYAIFTFDDGPSLYTVQISNILAQYGIRGVFFFIGVHMERRDPAGQIIAHLYENGHMVANHSYSHLMFDQMNQTMRKQEIDRTNILIKKATDQPVELYRPPYGQRVTALEDYVSQIGMTTVLWDKDPQDWDNKSSDAIISYIRNALPYGGIYLFHETPQTLEALPVIIEFLQEQGVEFLPLQ